MKSSESPESHLTLASSWSLLPKSAKLVREYFVPLLYVSVLPGLLLTLGSTFTRGHTTHTVDGSTTSTYSFAVFPSHSVVGMTLFSVGVAWALLSLAARYYVQLRAVNGKPVDITEAYRKTAKRILPMIGLTLVYLLLVTVGLFLLIVPGLIVVRRYFLAPYYMIDRDASIRQALRLSAAATKPISGYIWGVIGVFAVLGVAAGILGSIPLGIGAIIATFVDLLYVFAPALRYKEVRLGLRPPQKPLRKEWSTIEH